MLNEKVDISLVMIVKNEEKNLARCLESVKEIVDEIVIVDTGSEDTTKEIAQSFGAKIYDYKWHNDFSAARNFALSKAQGKWRLILDADEYIVAGSKEEIMKLNGNCVIGQVMRLDTFKGKDNEIGHSRTFLSRIIQEGIEYTGKIHEQINSKRPRVKVNISVAHDGYLHEDKSERNLAILFEVVKNSPEDTYILYQLAHTLKVAGRQDEAAIWYKKYYEKSQLTEGYRCTAIVDYMYNLIAVGDLEKGLQIAKQEIKQYNDSPDFNFVCAEFYRELVLSNVERYIEYLPLIEAYYIKCLEIGETTKYDSIVGTGSYAAAYNLGVWYEVTKQFDKAKTCYEMAVEWGYEKAAERMKLLA